MTEDGSGNGREFGNEEARAKRVLSEISSRAWEHPADRAALQALRKIPVFDDVLRSMFGFFGEKPIRLAFQANAVRVSDKAIPPYPLPLQGSLPDPGPGRGIRPLHLSDAHRERRGLRDGQALHHPEFGDDLAPER